MAGGYPGAVEGDISGGATAKLTREQKGRFVAIGGSLYDDTPTH